MAGGYLVWSRVRNLGLCALGTLSRLSGLGLELVIRARVRVWARVRN